MEVQVPMSRIAECKQAYSKQKAVIDDRVLCAGYPEGGKDSCRVIVSLNVIIWELEIQTFLIFTFFIDFRVIREVH